MNKVYCEMIDKRDAGLDFREREDFEEYVREFYDISDAEIREVWNKYRPFVIPDYGEFTDPWHFDR